MPIQNPVIVVPAITASELRDEYPVKPETVWSAVLNKAWERICLHPDDIRYELQEPARVRYDNVFSAVYGDLIDELRHNLTDRADRPVPVFPFAYDWRQPLAVTEAQLAAFIDEVIGRTSLLRHYRAADYHKDPRVDLVGHSMGGLIITGYLQTNRTKSRVGKVATLGTPFRGSFEAPIKVLTGTASLAAGNEANSREREAARITPALYHLIPAFAGAVCGPDGKDVDLFDADQWQPGVVQTIAEFIRLYGAEGPGNARDRTAEAKKLLQKLLDEAKAHRKRIEGFTLATVGMDTNAWLCVVGVNSTTRICLNQKLINGQPRYDLSGEDRKDEWTPDSRSVKTGDGTVPYLGAKPTFINARQLVCVRPDDLGYWELGDKLLLKAAGFHGTVPQVNLVQRLVVAHLKGTGGNDSVWGRPAPDVAANTWSPPIKGLKLKW